MVSGEYFVLWLDEYSLALSVTGGGYVGNQLSNRVQHEVTPPPEIGELVDCGSARRANGIGERENWLNPELLEILGGIMLAGMVVFWSLASAHMPAAQPMTSGDAAVTSDDPQAALSRMQADNALLRRQRDDERGQTLSLCCLFNLYQQQLNSQRPSALSNAIDEPDEATDSDSKEIIASLVVQRDELKAEAAELGKSLREPRLCRTTRQQPRPTTENSSNG